MTLHLIKINRWNIKKFKMNKNGRTKIEKIQIGTDNLNCLVSVLTSNFNDINIFIRRESSMPHSHVAKGIFGKSYILEIIYAAYRVFSLPHRLIIASITTLKCTKGNSLTTNLDYAEATPLFVVAVFLSRIWCDLPSQLVTQILHQKQSSPRCQVAPRCTKKDKDSCKKLMSLKVSIGSKESNLLSPRKKGCRLGTKFLHWISHVIHV